MLILVPVDGSEAALDAVRHVIELQDQGLDVACVLANVQAAPHLYEVVLAPDVDVLAGASREAAEDAMDAAREMLATAEIALDCQVGTGDPGRRLVEMAEEEGCEAIVMGSQGQGLLGGARLGSVCQWVLLHASVPVTIVRHGLAAAEEDEVASEEDAEAASEGP
jgi:nucleotide-binding universal stress UspA family protein